MTAVYKFKDLNALADYYAERAARARKEATSDRIIKKRAEELRYAAFIYEGIVELLRHTILGDVS